MFFCAIDGNGPFMSGTVGLLVGPPESGKSWVTIETVRQVISAGRVAVVLDWEGPAWRLANRLKELGCPPEQATALVRHCNPGSESLGVVLDEVRREDPALVVIDSAAKFYASHGLDGTRQRMP
jgi:predicted ATP-dependent serine protease